VKKLTVAIKLLYKLAKRAYIPSIPLSAEIAVNDTLLTVSDNLLHPIFI